MASDHWFSHPRNKSTIMGNEAAKVLVKDEADIVNILLLGETGVGKSTLINSFANYLVYPDFNDAKTSTLRHPIFMKFVVDTANKSEVLVTSGNSSNEDSTFGNSSTQCAKSYVFTVEGRTFRLIDTPGIGDARGSIQDAENFDNVLQYIGQFKYLHAICVLVQPNVTVLNTFFKYCVLELFTRLDKSASKNLVFVFTKTRGENYQAPNTIANLRTIARDMKSHNIDIPIKSGTDNDNVFFFDNEGFKYLIALQQNIHMQFSLSVMKQSWEKSCKASWDLLTYIIGGEGRNALEPHKVQDTLSINEARRLIVTLSKPLVDVTDLVQDNLLALKRHKKLIANENLTKDELLDNLYTPVVDIERKELSQPVTVCVADTCLEIYHVFSVRKYHYRQRCHNPCYLKKVPQEIAGTRELVHCSAMGGTETCKVCGCDFKLHMHIYYETTTVEKRMINPALETSSEADIKQQKKAQLKQMRLTAEAYQKEQTVITLAMAKFALFLKHNAMCPVNEAYEEYLEMQIARESVSDGDDALCNRYKKLLREHKEQKRVMREACGAIVKIDSAEINATIRGLYDLPKTGANIRELHEAMKVGSKREHRKTEHYLDLSDIKRPTFNLQPSLSIAEEDKMELIKTLIAQGKLADATAIIASFKNL